MDWFRHLPRRAPAAKLPVVSKQSVAPPCRKERAGCAMWVPCTAMASAELWTPLGSSLRVYSAFVCCACVEVLHLDQSCGVLTLELRHARLRNVVCSLCMLPMTTMMVQPSKIVSAVSNSGQRDAAHLETYDTSMNDRIEQVTSPNLVRSQVAMQEMSITPRSRPRVHQGKEYTDERLSYKSSWIPSQQMVGTDSRIFPLGSQPRRSLDMEGMTKCKCEDGYIFLRWSLRRIRETVRDAASISYVPRCTKMLEACVLTWLMRGLACIMT
eukprot:648465-Amphidinium_carterae.3